MKESEHGVREIILSAEVIRAQVKKLAEQISHDYAGKELHLVTVLKGAFVFSADLARFLLIPTALDFIMVSSYEGMERTGEVRILKDLSNPIRGKHVLIVEDIIDSGTTLHTLIETLKLRQPASLRICTLFSKTSQRKHELIPDYNGFTVPDEYFIGYGLDYNQHYRDLPYLATLRQEVYL